MKKDNKTISAYSCTSQKKEMIITTRKKGYDIYECNKCGNKFYSKTKKEDYMQTIQVSSEKELMDVSTEFIYEFDVATPGYASSLDMCQIPTFHLCDNCLIKLLQSFKTPLQIINNYGEEIDINKIGVDKN